MKHHDTLLTSILQSMQLDPPVERGREHMIRDLQRHLGQATELPSLNPQRFALRLAAPLVERSKRNYKNLLTRMNKSVLESCYEAIDAKYDQLEKYTKNWLQYEALFDMSTEDILSRLGDDLGKWEQLLIEIKKGKVDAGGTTKSFGPVQVDFAQAQVRINMKYDALHKDVQLRFGERVNSDIKAFYLDLEEAREKLEQVNLEAATTQEAITFLMTLQELKRNVGKWKIRLSNLESGENTLRKQRYKFPKDWTYVENLQGEWTAFNDILKRQNHIMQSSTESLQMQVTKENRDIERRTEELLAEWEENRPEGDDVSPEQAKAALAEFEAKFQKLKDEHDGIILAHEALDMDFLPDDRLDTGLEAVKSMKNSWAELSRVWDGLNGLQEASWASIQPKQLRQKLEGIMMDLNNLPPRVRNYSSYAVTENQIKEYLSVNKVISDMKTDALKDRHYDRLFKILEGDFPTDRSDLKLGHFWKCNLKEKQKAIMKLLSEAQVNINVNPTVC